MKKIFLVVSLLTFSCFAIAKGMPTLWQSELALGGIHHGDSKASVLVKLGKPESQDDPKQFKTPRFIYSGLTVWFGEGGEDALFFRSTSAKYCTPSGICPGMSFERARAVYTTMKIYKRDGDKFSAYFGSPMSFKLTFDVERDTITAIGAGYLAMFDIRPDS